MTSQGYVKVDSTKLTALLADAENAVRKRERNESAKCHAEWKAASLWERLWFKQSPQECDGYLNRTLCNQLTRIERLRTAAAAGDVFVNVDEYGAVVYWASWLEWPEFADLVDMINEAEAET